MPTPASAAARSLEGVTAICIDTVNHSLALAACRRMIPIGFGEVVLVTDARIRDHVDATPPGLRIEHIDPLQGVDAYSRFALLSAVDHVRTPHALFFQWDGFAIDPSAWSAGFLDYDYVGAPWAKIHAVGGRVVGNGGFSLRSARLMRAVRQIAKDASGPEDRVICVDLAPRLEAEFGIRFAPVEVARQFSVEHLTLIDGEDELRAPHGTFGFHGFFNFHLAHDDDASLFALIDSLDETRRAKLLTSWAATALLVNLSKAGRAEAMSKLCARMASAAGLAPGMPAQEVIDAVLARLGS